MDSRVTGIRAVLGDRLSIFVGVDDVIVEGVAAGAVGWIAGSSMRCLGNRSSCSTWRGPGSRRKPVSSTNGFFRSCAWTPFPSSSSSSARAGGSRIGIRTGASAPARSHRKRREEALHLSESAGPAAGLQPEMRIIPNLI